MAVRDHHFYHFFRAQKKLAAEEPPNEKKHAFRGVLSLDWFKGKSTGNHGFYHQI